MSSSHERDQQETAIRSGESWKDVAGSLEIPDQHITRILTFLGSTVQGDLVHTNFNAGSLLDDRPDVIEQMVLVGAGGAGRRLRRRRFDVSADELLRDVDAIYLCEADQGEAKGLRYVLVDVQPKGESAPGGKEAALVCRRANFEVVYYYLQMGGSGGAIWRGSSLEDRAPILELDEGDYVFESELLDRLRRETVGFLQGEIAARLRAWQVPAKNGIVLYGEPGNGKTVLTRLCAKFALEAGMDVVIIEGKRRSRLSFDRGTMGLGDELRRAAARSPALLLFEDIDLHCTRRPEPGGPQAPAPSDQEQPLAEVLDFLDGVERTDGYVLLASTNSMERLDPALTRPGRIDVTIKVEKPSPGQRLKALRAMIQTGPQPPPDPTRAADLLDGASFAGLAEVARRYKIAAAYAPHDDHQQQLEWVAEAFRRERDHLGEAEE